MRKLILILFSIISLTIFSNQMQEINLGLEEIEDWAPYEYFKYTDIKKTKPTGFNVNILNHIAQKYNLTINYIKMPWVRCLIELKEGKEIQAIFPTSLSEERRKNFYFSKSVYSITPHYFYLKENFPEGIIINESQDLLKYGTVGGIKGFNYINFGLQNHQIDRGAKDYQSLIQKLKSNRNKIILARYEVLAAYPLVSGIALLDEDIAFAPIPGVPKEEFHFLVSKKYKYGQQFIKIINTELDYLNRTGILKKWLNQYMDDAAKVQ
jgi:polar amino acid transport system substrate-binding protein